MSHPVARRTVRIDEHELVFEQWDDGSVLQPTVFPDDTLERARRSLTLHQVRIGEAAWFPELVEPAPLSPYAPYAQYEPDPAYAADPEKLLLAAARTAAKAEFGKALLWLGGGAAVTVVTYAVTPDGGSYVVFWGAMLYGAWRTVRALYFLANPGALVRRARR